SPYRCGERRAMAAMAGEEEGTKIPSQSLEMEEDQRPFAVDANLVVDDRNPVIADIPGRQIDAGMFQDFHPRRHLRKCVEIALVGKATAVDIVVAPLDALLPPPFDHAAAIAVVARADPTDVVDAEFDEPRDFRTEAMRGDGDGSVPQFDVDRFRRLEKVE